MFSIELGGIRKSANKTYLAAGLIFMILLISGCNASANFCYVQPLADLYDALSYAGDDQLPFQFPLDDLGIDDDPAPARFCDGSWQEKLEDRKYHAAEDYHLPAGSPVYAFADGEISFSGPMGGYGWLIIIDHPQFNIYSLYGHLSPSRWYQKTGIVEKGDLIAYLGDSDENGGSENNPLVTHLHFAVRVGQRRDYTGFGEWRWMAGWIKPCPTDLGWLKPSEVISNQEIPHDGFPEPKGGFFEKWQGELILTGIYVLVGIAVMINSFQKKIKLAPVLYGITMAIAGWYFAIKGTRLQYALYGLAVLGFGAASYLYIQGRKDALRPTEDRNEETGDE